MRQSNLFTVKQYEVEHLPVMYAGGKESYSRRVGFGQSTSPKKAWEMANKMFNKTSNGGCPIIGSYVMMKNGKVIKESRFDKWTKRDESEFQSFLQSYREELELKRLIAEEDLKK